VKAEALAIGDRHLKEIHALAQFKSLLIRTDEMPFADAFSCGNSVLLLEDLGVCSWVSTVVHVPVVALASHLYANSVTSGSQSRKIA